MYIKKNILVKLNLNVNNLRIFFQNLGILNFFRKIRIGERPYQCSQCENSFSSNKDLVNHSKIHIGENPHRCNICKNAFSLNEELEKHIATQSDEYKLQCDQSFTRKDTLNVHKKKHSGETKFQCGQCDKSYVRN